MEDQDERQLRLFRAAKDRFMRQDPQSPLAEDQRRSFHGLNYYPCNPALRLEVLLDRNVPPGMITLETSTGDAQEYSRAGKIQFSVDGQSAELTIYQSEGGGLFLPVRDATSGKETYGAGRYLEPEPGEEDRVGVDFNYLYNPYCAYNDAWSCPLPPAENWLRVPLRAGEKLFHA